MISVGLANRNHNVTLEIQKSVAGLLSIDPRLLKNKKDAQLIESIDYTTAREMIGERGAQAKLLHNQVLRDELQKAGVKVRLFDPSNTSHSGTLISNEKNTQSSGVEFVGKRSKVLYFTISSGNMETGFLQQLFAIAAKYGSVDFVSTTETEVTFTMDAANFEKTTPSQLAEDIRNTFGLTDDEHMENVKISDAKSLLFLIGQNLGPSKSALAEAILLLEKNNIRVDLTNDAAENRGYIL
jgi:aspartokinase